MGRFNDEELASIKTDDYDVVEGDITYHEKGETWLLERLAEDDYNRRTHDHEYKLTRVNSIRQGWVCGTFSIETAAQLAMMLARQVELDL